MKAWQQLTGLLTATLFITTTASAAKLVQPPIQDLFKERNQVTVLEVKSVDTENAKVEFKKVKDLWGETDDEITLKVPQDWLPQAKKGERFIIGHSAFRKHPILRDEIQPNPNGPEVLHPFVVDDALFDDSKALRYMVKEFQEKEPNTDKVLNKNLELLEEASGNTRLLAAFQFQMSEDLYAKSIDDDQLKHLHKILQMDDLTAEETEFLLRATMAFPDERRPDWIAQHCRDIIAKNPAPYDLQTFIPLTVKTCATILGNDGTSADTKILTQLLIGNAPGVSKGALRALEHLAPKETPQLIADVLKNNSDLHNETRGVLTTYMYEYALQQDGGRKY